ncbi:hypothetical protein GCM10010436_65730 [Paractinoplanes durhamensis]
MEVSVGASSGYVPGGGQDIAAGSGGASMKSEPEYGAQACGGSGAGIGSAGGMGCGGSGSGDGTGAGSGCPGQPPCACVISPSVISLGVTQPNQADPRAGPKLTRLPRRLGSLPAMQKWEYVTVPLLVHATKQILDNWGEDGWELVQVVPGPNPEQLVAYMKRPKS